MNVLDRKKMATDLMRWAKEFWPHCGKCQHDVERFSLEYVAGRKPIEQRIDVVADCHGALFVTPVYHHEWAAEPLARRDPRRHIELAARKIEGAIINHGDRATSVIPQVVRR